MIVPANLKHCTAMTSDVVYQNKANICKPVIAVYDTNGVKLAVNKDYDKNIHYYYKRDTEVICQKDQTTRESVTRKGNENPSLADEVSPMDIVPAGAELYAVISGKGFYQGTDLLQISVILLQIFPKRQSVSELRCIQAMILYLTRVRLK